MFQPTKWPNQQFIVHWFIPPHTGMKWITPLPLNSHDRGADLRKTGPWLIKGCPAVNLSGVMTALEEVEKGRGHFGGGMFYWRRPDPFSLDPPPWVNINVWPLGGWLLPLPHTSVDKKPLVTQYVDGKGRRRRSSYSQEVLVNYYYCILFFHENDSGLRSNQVRGQGS